VAFIALVVVVAGGQTTTATKSELVVYSGGASGKAGPKLAYDVLTRGVRADQTPSRLHTIVDATTGSRLASWDEIENRTGNGQGIHVGPVSLDTTAGPPWSMRDAEGNDTADLNGSDTGPGATFTSSADSWGGSILP
jgi:hypothetical protein